MQTNNTSIPISISIILPCYNPAIDWVDTLRGSVDDLNQKLPDCKIQYIVSNDGSTRLDKEQVNILSQMDGVLFLDNPINEGKGSAIRKGTIKAEGEIIVYTDLDFPFGTTPIVEMVKIFRDRPECWFIYGKRDGAYFKKLPLKRKVFSKSLQILNRLVLSKHISDTQAGIKGLRRTILPEIQSTRTNTFVFEVELIYKLVKKGIGIEKVDVSAKPTIVFSDFRLKVLFREAYNFVKIVITTSIWNDIL